MKKICLVLSCLVLSCLVLSCSKIEDYFGIEDIEDIEDRLLTVEKENEEQKEKNKILEEKIIAIEDFLKNYQNIQEQITSLSKIVDDNYETLISEIKNCGYDDTEIVNSLNNLRENITAEKIEIQDKLLSAFADKEEILNKTVKDLSEDIKKLENIIKEKNDTEELKNEIIELSNRIDVITQVDLITVKYGFIYFWNTDKKLLSYQSKEVFAYFYYYDNGGFNLEIAPSYPNGNKVQRFVYNPESNRFINDAASEFYCWYCYEHDLIFKTVRYIPFCDCNCESALSGDNIKVQLKNKNSSLLFGNSGYTTPPDLVKNYMIDYCSLPLEYY